MSSSTSEQTINIPQLILVLVMSALAIRYFFFTGPSPSNANSSQHTRSASNVRAREADVEMIQQMFPQVTRRNIMWDLQRNGGNVPATTERILSGRGLESVCIPAFLIHGFICTQYHEGKLRWVLIRVCM